MEKKRAITAWIFLGITITAVIIGGWALWVFLTALMCFGMKELLAMMNSKDLNPSVVTSYLSCLIFFTLGTLSQIQYLHLATIFLIILAFLVILKRGENARIRDIGATLICVIYGGLFPSHFLFLRNIDAGTFNLLGYDMSLALGFVFLMVICITATDVFAYFGGCKFGKHKLWPAVSPKKTIEGSVAGIFGSLLFSLLIGYFIGLELWQSIAVGLVITISAQLGDLIESSMKRDAGAKDASDILPGHGGFLDRADSYIFTTATTYYFFYYFVVYPIWVF